MHSFFKKVNKLLRDILVRPNITQLVMTPIQYGEILRNKRVIVTGGSEGIGFAIAKKMIDLGANVVITGRDVAKLDNAKKRINSDNLHVLAWDVSDLDNNEVLFEEAVSVLNGLDILVNNAAILVSEKRTDREFYEKTMDTNMESVYLLSQRAIKEFMGKNNGSGGKIINISSMNSFQCSTSPYCLSKYGVNAITKGFAAEYSKFNIQINAIAPGYCNSSINKVKSMSDVSCDITKINRIIFPEEIAEIAAFLASNAANGIVGQVILCDGGSTLQNC